MIVLDASAGLAYLLNEPGGSLVRLNLSSSIMSTVNLVEVARRLRRDRDHAQTQAICSALMRKLQGVEDVRTDDIFTAAEIYARYQKSHNIALGDAICLAVGLRLQAEVWTADAIWAALPDVGQVKVIR